MHGAEMMNAAWKEKKASWCPGSASQPNLIPSSLFSFDFNLLVTWMDAHCEPNASRVIKSVPSPTDFYSL